MLLNVCIYYKTVLNVQCSNLMFQLICDKYFPIMAWQREERSGTPACRTADCSISRQFKPCVLGEADHLKFSLPLQTQQLQRLSCCAYYYLFNFLLLLFFLFFLFYFYPNFIHRDQLSPACCGSLARYFLWFPAIWNVCLIFTGVNVVFKCHSLSAFSPRCLPR